MAGPAEYRRLTAGIRSTGDSAAAFHSGDGKSGCLDSVYSEKYRNRAPGPACTAFEPVNKEWFHRRPGATMLARQ